MARFCEHFRLHISKESWFCRLWDTAFLGMKLIPSEVWCRMRKRRLRCWAWKQRPLWSLQPVFFWDACWPAAACGVGSMLSLRAKWLLKSICRRAIQFQKALSNAQKYIFQWVGARFIWIQLARACTYLCRKIFVPNVCPHWRRIRRLKASQFVSSFVSKRGWRNSMSGCPPRSMLAVCDA